MGQRVACRPPVLPTSPPRSLPLPPQQVFIEPLLCVSRGVRGLEGGHRPGSQAMGPGVRGPYLVPSPGCLHRAPWGTSQAQFRTPSCPDPGLTLLSDPWRKEA